MNQRWLHLVDQKKVQSIGNVARSNRDEEQMVSLRFNDYFAGWQTMQTDEGRQPYFIWRCCIHSNIKIYFGFFVNFLAENTEPLHLRENTANFLPIMFNHPR